MDLLRAFDLYIIIVPLALDRAIFKTVVYVNLQPIKILGPEHQVKSTGTMIYI